MDLGPLLNLLNWMCACGHDRGRHLWALQQPTGYCSDCPCAQFVLVEPDLDDLVALERELGELGELGC